MKLFTRRQVIEIWEQQTNKSLDMYCCPNCRDLLIKHKESYTCVNGDCALHGILYKEEDIENES